VLVTGGAGLIGMAVRARLAAHGHAVVPTDINDFGRGDAELELVSITDRTALEDVIVRHRIEAIVHCGAISGPMMAVGQPLLLVDVNVNGTACLLDLARVHGMRRFVFCSSISVYGNVGPETITEDTRLQPTSVYGATKAACEQLVEGFASEFGLDGVSLRIARVYGPYRRAHCHLGNMIRDAAAGRQTEVACDPAFLYHYVFVDDVAGAIQAALEAGTVSRSRRAYNVGSGEAMTMPHIVAVARATLAGAVIRMVPGADDVPDVQTAFDQSQILADLKWKPHYDLARGLAAYASAIASGRAAC
jgi:UDP-glucuronate 4-epimerase